MASSSPIQTSAPADAAPATNYGPLLSSQLIGSLLSFFFFGALVIQVYVYRLCFPKDMLGLKLYVYFIFLVMTLCTCLIASDIEVWFGSGFGNVAGLEDARNSRLYNPLFGRAAWPLALLTCLLALAQCAGGMGAGVISYMDGNTVHDDTRTVFVYLWLIGSATVNLLISGTMTCLLLAAETAERGIVKSAVRMVIETNIWTAIAALLGLLLYVACPNTTYWICPMMILPGIYANTLLISLNNRSTQREVPDAPKGNAFTSSNLRSSGVTTNSRSPLARTGTLYSANGVGRVLSVPAMSFARQESVSSSGGMRSVQEKPPAQQRGEAVAGWGGYG
ncbi:hypothetical protein MSAN_01145600 [Mycena sanguinolenta]|uniref:DUF6534 domain-containing protein n=1 Tax=Mycena sanguinolenta TaxID=230812 RepID=A0A8H7D6Z4_9AGAR|nr:hypothetical protein MSAN_01145600 [Mycena sanguinolenta]